jgi:septal ring factor EnvC (AmiA/AmiB activator)
MSCRIPEEVDANMFDRPQQRRPQTVNMSYSDIARSSGSPLTQSQNNSQDGASVDTTIVSNVSRQETNDSGMNMITGLSLMKKRMEEIDNQREAFTTKQQRTDESISTVTSSVSKFSADILAVRIDMNIMSDKLEKNFNEIIALLATTQTTTMPSSPTRKVSRGRVHHLSNIWNYEKGMSNHLAVW